MPKSLPKEKGESRTNAWVVLAMLATVIIPAAIALFTVRSPATIQLVRDPSPRGYTWSLLLFIAPITVIAFWFLLHKDLRIPRKAFWRTIAILVPLGCALDFFFATWFFVFPNTFATLGFQLPVLGGSVPVEEYLFYLTGFHAVLLIYVWLDEYWLAAYNVPDYKARSKQIPRLVQFHGFSLIVGVIVIVAAVIFKKFFAAKPEGFPSYFIILVGGGMVPAVGFYPSAKEFINWRALSFTMFFILLVSLLWEATLAIPYGWWGYNESQMIGIFIGGWSRLPIEAVCVWIAVTYATIILFEVVKLWQASSKSALRAFLGSKSPSKQIAK
jgi:hypothetical protein